MNDLIVTTPGGRLAVPNRRTAEQVILAGRASEFCMDIARLVKKVRENNAKDFVECPVVHRFTDRMYIRECNMPKGVRVVSKIHLTEHLFVLSKGIIAVWTEADGVKVFTAPHYGITPPGTLRLLMAVEDSVWTTFHFSELKDVAKLEADLVVDPERLLVEK